MAFTNAKPTALAEVGIEPSVTEAYDKARPFDAQRPAAMKINKT